MIELYEKSKQGNWENSWQSCAYYRSDLMEKIIDQEVAKLIESINFESKQVNDIRWLYVINKDTERYTRTK